MEKIRALELGILALGGGFIIGLGLFYKGAPSANPEPPSGAVIATQKAPEPSRTTSLAATPKPPSSTGTTSSTSWQSNPGSTVSAADASSNERSQCMRIVMGYGNDVAKTLREGGTEDDVPYPNIPSHCEKYLQ